MQGVFTHVILGCYVLGNNHHVYYIIGGVVIAF